MAAEKVDRRAPLKMKKARERSARSKVDGELGPRPKIPLCQESENDKEGRYKTIMKAARSPTLKKLKKIQSYKDCIDNARDKCNVLI